MQKTQFIEHVAKEAGVTRTEADKIVRAALKVIQDELAGGGEVSLIGFGTFEVRERSARTVSHIRTKEKVEIPASKIPAFSAGKELRTAVTSGKAAPAAEALAKKAPARRKAAAS